jgi:hypothetical protein
MNCLRSVAPVCFICACDAPSTPLFQLGPHMRRHGLISTTIPDAELAASKVQVAIECKQEKEQLFQIHKFSIQYHLSTPTFLIGIIC